MGVIRADGINNENHLVLIKGTSATSKRAVGFTEQQTHLKQQRIDALVGLACDEVAVFALMSNPRLTPRRKISTFEQSNKAFKELVLGRRIGLCDC